MYQIQAYALDFGIVLPTILVYGPFKESALKIIAEFL